MQPNLKKPLPCTVSLGSLQQPVYPTCPEKINACVWTTANQDRWKQIGRPPDTFVRENKTCGHSFVCFSPHLQISGSSNMNDLKYSFFPLTVADLCGSAMTKIFGVHKFSSMPLKVLIKRCNGFALHLHPSPPPRHFTSFTSCSRWLF